MNGGGKASGSASGSASVTTAVHGPDTAMFLFFIVHETR
jgi:hypothetical protein